jgi:alkanesulfonate monooxygenase
VTIEVLWRLPPSGDGRAIRADRWTRGDYSPDRKLPHPYARTGVQRDGYTYYDQLSQIARAAELTGLDGLWIPQSPAGEEPLVVAGSLAREVRRLTFVPSLRAPLISAVYAAKIAVSFQRLSGGRLAWHLATEDDQGTRPWHGRRWSVAEQIARTSELLDLARGFWTEPPFTYKGRYYEVQDGGFAAALQGEAFPRVYLSDGPDDALAVSARHADVHILPLGPVESVRARIAEIDRLAAAHGRTLRYGIEADVVARPSSDEAWHDVRREWQDATDKTVPISAAVAPVGSPREFDDRVIGTHLWSGFGRVRPGPSVGFVGGYVDLADSVAEYVKAGVSTFVLSANPHLEEAYRIGEQLLPLVRARTSEVSRRAV